MASKFVSMRNIKFMLNEVLNISELLQNPYFSGHSQKSADMILDAAMKIGTKLLNPTFTEMDRIPPELENGEVKVHPQVKAIMREFGENGWISASFKAEHGGDQLPMLVANCCNMIFCAANYSGSVYMGLSAGAAKLIYTFGDESLKKKYAENLVSGKWQGTMALTESQAGSSLADLTTTAYPTDEGHYKIKGQKIFISAGDHNCVDNVVHLMLARIDGAPAGVKGISLFVVPKKRITEKGLEYNDVAVSQVFHKLGYRGAPITELVFGEKDDCHGYLLGEPGKGLGYMFQMMNGARLEVGLGAAAIASAAYYSALDYSESRLQGRELTSKDPASAQLPIMSHADVKRMLLFQKSIFEGAFSLILQCSKYEDLCEATTAEEKERWHLLLDLLTPVAKTYPAEMGILATSQSIQCFGGYGYCEDFPVEQHFRDMRIHTIHEGTTGIQAMDLLGRKAIMKNGKAMAIYFEEVGQTIAAAKGFEKLRPLCQQLEDALKTLQDVTMHLVGIAMGGKPDVFLADATLYIEMFGNIAVAWQWLLMATAALKALEKNPSKSETSFYEGKVFTCRYYFAYELVKISGLATRLKDGNPITMEMETRHFSD